MIHKAGYIIIAIITIILTTIVSTSYILIPVFWISIIISIAAALFLLFILRFFRVPKRTINYKEGDILCPADGHIVVIEKIHENEFLKKETIQISIFMSVWNVHINWFPFEGTMKKFVYHPGKFLIARHPKSSTLNERTSILMETKNNVPILIRQIAGIVARRIENYVQTDNSTVKIGQEMGFIKFGSRVDIFLPTDAKINVKVGDNVQGLRTKLAEL